MYKSNFRKVLAEHEAKYGKVFKFNCMLRRFKRKYFTSTKKKEEEHRRFHEELSECFNIEPATYYQDQPH